MKNAKLSADIGLLWMLDNQTKTLRCIGSEFTNTQVRNTEDQINYLMQALGSRIWAVTLQVMDAIGLDMSAPQLRAEYMELYKKQPLIYNNLQAKLPKPKM